MILTAIKSDMEAIALGLNAVWTVKSHAEIEDYAQNYNYIQPQINLLPIENVTQNKLAGGAIRYDFRFQIYFLTKFHKDDTLEENKDVLIDNMLTLSENFFRELDKNNNLLYISNSWSWSANITRQYTSNLLCGCIADIRIDSACNRV